jgi:hypothetical protein
MNIFIGEKQTNKQTIFSHKDKTVPDYLPKAMDFTSVTMNPEMQARHEQ